MTIKKTGTVNVTEETVLITGFHFDQVSYYPAQLEAIDWAIQRLHKAADEARSLAAEHSVSKEKP